MLWEELEGNARARGRTAAAAVRARPAHVSRLISLQAGRVTESRDRRIAVAFRAGTHLPILNGSPYTPSDLVTVQIGRSSRNTPES
jgi:hypothetical protein